MFRMIYTRCVADSVDQLMASEKTINADIQLKVPIGTWPKDPRLKHIGMYHRENVIASVEPYTLALFTRVLGWSYERTQAMIAGQKNEFNNLKNHFYTITHFVYGRKPA
jgi:hypothetical protein